MKLQQAQSALLRMIEDGRFASDRRLPPERDLCTELGVSRSTLRKVLDHLEAQGIVSRHVGRGTFIGQQKMQNPAALLEIGDQTSPSELMELRLMLEPQIARLAAMRASPADIAYLRHCVDRSESADDSETYELWDSTLHRAIALAAHNTMVLAVFDAANELRRLTVWGGLRASLLTPHENLLYWRKQHRDIVEAIAARDPGQAEHLARVHVEDLLRCMETPDRQR